MDVLVYDTSYILVACQERKFKAARLYKVRRDSVDQLACGSTTGLKASARRWLRRASGADPPSGYCYRGHSMYGVSSTGRSGIGRSSARGRRTCVRVCLYAYVCTVCHVCMQYVGLHVPADRVFCHAIGKSDVWPVSTRPARMVPMVTPAGPPAPHGLGWGLYATATSTAPGVVPRCLHRRCLVLPGERFRRGRCRGQLATGRWGRSPSWIASSLVDRPRHVDAACGACRARLSCLDAQRPCSSTPAHREFAGATTKLGIDAPIRATPAAKARDCPESPAAYAETACASDVSSGPGAHHSCCALLLALGDLCRRLRTRRLAQ